jgi:hypothetical protein
VFSDDAGRIAGYCCTAARRLTRECLERNHDYVAQRDARSYDGAVPPRELRAHASGRHHRRPKRLHEPREVGDRRPTLIGDRADSAALTAFSSARRGERLGGRRSAIAPMPAPPTRRDQAWPRTPLVRAAAGRTGTIVGAHPLTLEDHRARQCRGGCNGAGGQRSDRADRHSCNRCSRPFVVPTPR